MTIMKSDGNFTSSDLMEMTCKLREITNPNNEKIYAGDIYKSIDFVDEVVQTANTSMENMTRDNITSFAKVTNVTSLGTSLI